MKTQPRITKKLGKAAVVLVQERLADADPKFITTLYQNGEITAGQIYAACRHFGYRWDTAAQMWRLEWPRWLKRACLKRDQEIMKGWKS